jgi:uncharacterized protein
MKKKFVLFSMCLALLLMLIPFSAFADGEDLLSGDESSYIPLVIDNAGLLTDEEELRLSMKLDEIRMTKSFDAVVLTEYSIGSKSAMEYADDYFDYNGYGQGENRDGCLLLISMENRDWWISTRGYGITAITDYGKEVIEDAAVPYLSDGDYYTACSTYAEIVEDCIVSANNGTPYDVNNHYVDDYGHEYSRDGSGDSKGFDSTSLLAAFVCAVIIAVIVASSVKKSYKPVRFNANASNYLVDGSLNVTQSYDTFLYKNVTSVKIERSSSSGGSSTHTSSSGASHGGGGGHF